MLANIPRPKWNEGPRESSHVILRGTVATGSFINALTLKGDGGACLKLHWITPHSTTNWYGFDSDARTGKLSKTSFVSFAQELSGTVVVGRGHEGMIRGHYLHSKSGALPTGDGIQVRECEKLSLWHDKTLSRSGCIYSNAGRRETGWKLPKWGNERDGELQFRGYARDCSFRVLEESSFLGS